MGALIRAVDRNVDGRILVNISQTKTSGNDQLLRLETWSKDISWLNDVYLHRRIGRTCRNEDTIAVNVDPLLNNAFYNIRNS